MAVIENGVVLAIGLGNLVEALGDQIGADAVTGHEGERGLEEVEPSQRREWIDSSSSRSALTYLRRLTELTGGNL
jgi:hypothetical protein